MLPQFTKKSVAGLIISQRKPDEGKEPEADSPDTGLEACASDLIAAVHAKDTKAVTAALKAAYELMDAPTDQEDNSFEAQNMKAAE